MLLVGFYFGDMGMIERMEMVTAFMAILSVVIFIIVLPFWLINEYRCSNYEEMSGMPTKYKLADGCYVKTSKGWFLKEQLRDIEAGK